MFGYIIMFNDASHCDNKEFNSPGICNIWKPFLYLKNMFLCNSKKIDMTS